MDIPLGRRRQQPDGFHPSRFPICSSRLLTEKDENLAVVSGKKYQRIFAGKWPVCLGQLCHSHRRPAFQRRPRRIESLHELLASRDRQAPF